MSVNYFIIKAGFIVDSRKVVNFFQVKRGRKKENRAIVIKSQKL
jgi:hypothetical protein